jgi:hypothetical protein
MGNFYTNITLAGPSQHEIAGSLQAIDRQSIVSPTRDGMTIVWDCASEAQDESGYRLAAHLAAKFRCVSLAVMVHDDDVLYYRLYSSGNELDRYDSSPGYFTGLSTPPSGGDAKAICEAFHAPQARAQVQQLLHAGMNNAGESKYVFEMDRHKDLVDALKLPDWSVATGFKYLMQGEWPQGLRFAECVTVQGKCSETVALLRRYPVTEDGQLSGFELIGVLAAAVLIMAYFWRRRSWRRG